MVTEIALVTTKAPAPPTHVRNGWERAASAMSAKLVRSNTSSTAMTTKTTAKPVSHPRSTRAAPGSGEMIEEAFHAPVAVGAREDHWTPFRDLELALDRLGLVRDAVRIGAPQDADDAVRKVDRPLLLHLEVADDRDRRLGGDEGDGVHLTGRELHVLDLHDVLPAELPRTDPDRDADG